MNVGIPNALHYHYTGPAWEAFFQALDCNVTVSPPTNEDILARGLRHALRDLCLPMKAYFGHLDFLKTRVERVFAPRLVADHPCRYYCPKFLALVDLAATVLPREQLLWTEINARKGADFSRRSFASLGRTLGGSAAKVEAALAAMDEATTEAKARRAEDYRVFVDRPPEQVGVALLGHPYIVRDAHLSTNVAGWFAEQGVSVSPYETVPLERLAEVDPGLFRDVYWDSGWHLFRAALHLMGVCEGSVFLTAFGCGPDSFLVDLLARRAREAGHPFLTLILDEHAAEVGVRTRLEAFLDMVQMQRLRRPE
jgi:predicted nucleotide-binding protein (sugar kinase/HSP70/actin superfamily)